MSMTIAQVIGQKRPKKFRLTSTSGDQLPVQMESGPVPTHHRFGRDHNEGLLPSGPKSTNGDPEELVEQV
jgi:hypothetical protein